MEEFEWLSSSDWMISNVARWYRFHLLIFLYHWLFHNFCLYSIKQADCIQFVLMWGDQRRSLILSIPLFFLLIKWLPNSSLIVSLSRLNRPIQAFSWFKCRCFHMSLNWHPKFFVFIPFLEDFVCFLCNYLYNVSDFSWFLFPILRDYSNLCPFITLHVLYSL